VDVASVGAVDPATLAATDLINILKVIGSSFTAIPNDYLAVLVHETDGGCALFHDYFFRRSGPWPTACQTSSMAASASDTFFCSNALASRSLFF
jgi:hypothetical protein